MHIFAFDRHHIKHPWVDAPPWALELRIMLGQILEKENEAMVDYTKLQADVAAQTTVLQSIAVGVQGLNTSNADLTKQVATLQAALAANDQTAVQAAADAIDASVQSNTALVANLIPAVTANTPTPVPDASAAAAVAAAPSA